MYHNALTFDFTSALTYIYFFIALNMSTFRTTKHLCDRLQHLASLQISKSVPIPFEQALIWFENCTWLLKLWGKVCVLPALGIPWDTKVLPGLPGLPGLRFCFNRKPGFTEPGGIILLNIHSVRTGTLWKRKTTFRLSYDFE